VSLQVARPWSSQPTPPSFFADGRSNMRLAAGRFHALQSGFLVQSFATFAPLVQFARAGSFFGHVT
jgi:hypothetical protein